MNEKQTLDYARLKRALEILRAYTLKLPNQRFEVGYGGFVEIALTGVLYVQMPTCPGDYILDRLALTPRGSVQVLLNGMSQVRAQLRGEQLGSVLDELVCNPFINCALRYKHPPSPLSGASVRPQAGEFLELFWAVLLADQSTGTKAVHCVLGEDWESKFDILERAFLRALPEIALHLEYDGKRTLTVKWGPGHRGSLTERKTKVKHT